MCIFLAGFVDDSSIIWHTLLFSNSVDMSRQGYWKYKQMLIALFDYDLHLLLSWRFVFAVDQ